MAFEEFALHLPLHKNARTKQCNVLPLPSALQSSRVLLGLETNLILSRVQDWAEAAGGCGAAKKQVSRGPLAEPRTLGHPERGDAYLEPLIAAN